MSDKCLRPAFRGQTDLRMGATFDLVYLLADPPLLNLSLHLREVPML